MKYELKVAHLYGDLLNTYGDNGNLLALNYYAKMMDTKLDTQIVSIDDQFVAKDWDIFFFGGGQD